MITTSNNPFGHMVRRRSFRRGVVIFYWILAVFFLVLILQQTQTGRLNSFLLLFSLQLILTLPASLLGGVRTGGIVKPFNGVNFVPLQERDEIQSVLGAAKPAWSSCSSDDLNLDEREATERNQIHFAAYSLVRWLSLALMVVYLFVILVRPAWNLQLGPALFVLLTLLLWSLPQSMILWKTPDMESES